MVLVFGTADQGPRTAVLRSSSEDQEDGTFTSTCPLVGAHQPVGEWESRIASRFRERLGLMGRDRSVLEQSPCLSVET